MTTITDDIREWERDQAQTNHLTVPDEAEGERPVVDPDKVEERPPNIPTPRVGTGLKNLRDRAKALRAKSPAARKTPSRVLKPRVSVEKLIGHAWSLVARMLTPVSVPVARVMQVQAPVAGMVLEDVVKNTVVDKLLQPLARVEGNGEVVFALVGPPLLVGMISSRPDLANILVPLLRESLRSWIEIAGPKIEKIQKQEQDFADKYGVQIDQMIQYFLAPIDAGDDGSSTVIDANNG